MKRIAEGRLILELWPPRGAPLLFYPGTMLEPGHYRLFLNSLAKAGFSVCALHLPGHGLNVSPLRTFADALELGQKAEAWLNCFYNSEVALCGHSQGGILAMAHAARTAGKAPCFAICSVYPDMAEAIELTRFAPFARWRGKIMATISALGRIAPRMPVPLPFYLSLRRLLMGLEKPLAYGAGEGPCSYPLEFINSLFSAHIPRPSKRPFWLFAAENDGLFSSPIIRRVFNLSAPPAGKIVWLHKGGHLAIFNPQLASYVARSCACATASLGFPLLL